MQKHKVNTRALFFLSVLATVVKEGLCLERLAAI